MVAFIGFFLVLAFKWHKRVFTSWLRVFDVSRSPFAFKVTNGIDSGYHIIRPWGGNASIRTVEYTQLAQCCMMTISLFLTEFSSRGSVFTTTLCSMYACWKLSVKQCHPNCKACHPTACCPDVCCPNFWQLFKWCVYVHVCICEYHAPVWCKKAVEVYLHAEIHWRNCMSSKCPRCVVQMFVARILLLTI